MTALGRRMIANTIAGTTDLGDGTYVGDGSVFTDPVRFERECEILFRSMPQVIAWAGDVAEPGDIVARDVAGVPVVVIRGEDGQLRAFLNACSHRGMTLCDGVDNARRLTCPYHAWSYGLDGALREYLNATDSRDSIRRAPACNRCRSQNRVDWFWSDCVPTSKSTAILILWVTSIPGWATTGIAAAASEPFTTLRTGSSASI